MRGFPFSKLALKPLSQHAYKRLSKRLPKYLYRNLSRYLHKQGVATYLNHRLSHLWPDIQNLSLLTLGRFSENITASFHPAYHIHGFFSITPELHASFPSKTKTFFCQLGYHEFPFQKCSFDRILYVHDPHISSSQLPILLRSCWDTLSDHGSLILILPNRLKWWNVFHPISFLRQDSFFISTLQKMLNEHMFQLVYQERILYFPDKIMNSLSLYENKLLEFIGHFFIPFGGGYHLLAVRKNLYAPISVLSITNNEILQRNLSKPHWNCKK